MSKATPQRNNSSFKFFSTLQLHQGSLKGFMFFKEFNSPWLIFLSVMNFQPPPSCFVLRTPRPATARGTGPVLGSGRVRVQLHCRNSSAFLGPHARLARPSGVGEGWMDSILHQCHQ